MATTTKSTKNVAPVKPLSKGMGNGPSTNKSTTNKQETVEGVDNNTTVSTDSNGSESASGLITSGVACMLACIQPATMQKWMADGFVVAKYNGGKGRGKGRAFTPMQVLALMVAGELRESPRGCKPEYVFNVYSKVSNMTEEEVENTDEVDGIELAPLYKRLTSHLKSIK